MAEAQTMTEQMLIRNRACYMIRIPFNPGAALYKAAARANLGAPLAGEGPYVSADGDEYRLQPFALGIVYCRYGDWGNVLVVKW